MTTTTMRCEGVKKCGVVRERRRGWEREREKERRERKMERWEQEEVGDKWKKK